MKLVSLAYLKNMRCLFLDGCTDSSPWNGFGQLVLEMLPHCGYSGILDGALIVEEECLEFFALYACLCVADNILKGNDRRHPLWFVVHYVLRERFDESRQELLQLGSAKSRVVVEITHEYR
jgi:hypothetical protein